MYTYTSKLYYELLIVFIAAGINDFLTRAFSFPTRNIPTICLNLRRLIVTRKVPFHILTRRSGFPVESNSMPLTHA